MSGTPRTTPADGARARHLLSATTAALALGSLVLLVASVVAFSSAGLALGLAFAGLAVAVAGLALQDSRVALRAERLADDQLLARLALETIAVDGSATARTLARLVGVTERGMRAALVHRLRMSPTDAAAEPDPSLLAAVIALSPRHVLFLGEASDAEALTAALASLSPKSRLHAVPPGATAGAVIERLAVRLRSEKLPLPLVVALGHAHVREGVWGATALLILERFRTTDFLVAVTAGAHSVVNEPPRTPRTRATAVADALVLVSARPAATEEARIRGARGGPPPRR